MEGSKHRILKLTRAVVSSAVLAGVVAVAGCGGGGGNNSAVPPPPVKSAPSSGGLVGAEGTQGLVGPVERATHKGTSFADRSGKISPKANQKTGAQKHGVAGGAACDNGGVTPTADNLDVVNAAILCLVNAERADAGLPAVGTNDQLRQAAEGMAARMVKEQFFSHDTPDGKSLVDRVEPTGYIPNSGDWVVGENLAWGSGALSTPQAIVNGWMNSPGHKANILATDYKDVGLAAAMGSPSPSQSGGTVYVNDFGAKSGADTNATLPAESGAEAASTSAATPNGQVVASKKASTKGKKKKKRRHKRH
ncbi:MAG: CAP domain-containing protein [Thermoleophilaceae bacterium]